VNPSADDTLDSIVEVQKNSSHFILKQRTAWKWNKTFWATEHTSPAHISHDTSTFDQVMFIA